MRQMPRWARTLEGMAVGGALGWLVNQEIGALIGAVIVGWVTWWGSQP